MYHWKLVQLRELPEKSMQSCSLHLLMGLEVLYINQLAVVQ